MDEKISIEKLAAPMPKEAIQKTSAAQTRKGYDTTGFGYQFIVNRFNDVLGLGWGFNWQLIKETQGKYKSGTPFWELTVQVNIWVSDPTQPRSCVGGHTAMSFGDAYKGAISNGFKKTAAFWGVGRQAFEGTLDDDAIEPESRTQKTQAAPEKTVANALVKQVVDEFPGAFKDNPLPEKDINGMSIEDVLQDYDNCSSMKEFLALNNDISNKKFSPDESDLINKKKIQTNKRLKEK